VHEAVDPALGHCGQVRERDGEDVECEGDGLPVEVPAAQQLAVLEYQRIVGRRVQLARHERLRELDRVCDRPMDLWHAPQRIGVLYTRIAVPMRLPNLAVREQFSQQRRRSLLSCLAAYFVNACVECHRCPQQCLERHRARHVRRMPEPPRIGHREGCNGRVCLRAIDERDPFLGAERDRRQPERAKHVRCVTGA